MLSDSVSALSIGKRIASGCEFRWMPVNDNKAGSCTLTEPDNKEIEFKVDEHDVPYLIEYRETTAVPASIDHNKSVLTPAATPASPPSEDPEEMGQQGPGSLRMIELRGIVN